LLAVPWIAVSHRPEVHRSDAGRATYRR